MPNDLIPIRLTLPVRNAGHNDPFNVRKDRLPVLALERRRVRNQASHIAGLNVRKDASIPDILQIIGDIVDHLLPC